MPCRLQWSQYLGSIFTLASFGLEGFPRFTSSVSVMFVTSGYPLVARHRICCAILLLASLSLAVYYSTVLGALGSLTLRRRQERGTVRTCSGSEQATCERLFGDSEPAICMCAPSSRDGVTKTSKGLVDTLDEVIQR